MVKKKITEEDLLKRGFEKSLDNFRIEDIGGLDFYYRTDDNTVDIRDSHNEMHCGCCITAEAKSVSLAETILHFTRRPRLPF